MSGSQSKTSTSSSQSTNVSELNLQDTGGITVADNTGNTKVNYTSVTTDNGAIQAAGNLAGTAVGAALGANTDVVNSAINLASGLSSDVSSAAITLGQTAIDTGGALANKGLDNAAAAYTSGLTFGTNALDTVAQIASNSLSAQTNLTNNALAGYQTIAQQNSASDASQIQKIALYALAAAVLVVVLPAMFKQ